MGMRDRFMVMGCIAFRIGNCRLNNMAGIGRRMPITMAAFELTEKSGFYQKNPGTDVAVQQMVRKVTDKSRGIRLGNYVQIRTIEDEEMEQVWSGKKSAKDALDAIVKRGDELLVRFEQANSKK